MNRVTKIRLGNIVNFKRGYDLPSYNRIEGKYPIISSSGISGYHSEYKKDGEGLITGRYGTLGVMYYINGKYWPHNTALYATDFKGNYPKYVYFLMKCLGNLKTSNKSTVPGVNRNDLHEIFIPYIKPEYQKSIADCLFLIDSKIELNNHINIELEAIEKTLYDYWFVQFDFPNRDGSPYKTSGGEMVWNKDLNKEIPLNWEVKNLSSLFDYLEGPGITKEKYTKNGHNFININCIKDDDLDISNASMIKNEFIKVYSHFLLKENDIVISTSGTLGRSALVRKEHLPLLLNTSVIRFRTKNENYFNYMYSYLKSEYFLKNLIKSATGSIQKNFGPTHLNKFKEAFPNEILAKQFQKITKPIRKNIINLKLQNQELIRLHDWLLPMLMNGQVTVGCSAENKASYEIEEEIRIAAEPE